MGWTRQERTFKSLKLNPEFYMDGGSKFEVYGHKM